MNNDLLNKITAWEPRAVWTEGGDGMFTVPADGFHDLAGRLRADGFDFLRSLTGMDWGEAGFGVVYHLEATAKPLLANVRMESSLYWLRRNKVLWVILAA